MMTRQNSYTQQSRHAETIRLDNRILNITIGAARILSRRGGALFCQKVDDLFLVVALKNRLNIPPNLSHPAKTVLKLTLALAGGALTHFPCKLGLKIFFTALGGAGAPTAPPGYAYEHYRVPRVKLSCRPHSHTGNETELQSVASLKGRGGGGHDRPG